MAMGSSVVGASGVPIAGRAPGWAPSKPCLSVYLEVLKTLAPPSSFPHREKLDSFLPAHLCKRSHGLFAALRGRGARAGTGEQGLLNAYRQVKETVSSDGAHEATLGTHYRAYLLKCHELPFYG